MNRRDFLLLSSGAPALFSIGCGRKGPLRKFRVATTLQPQSSPLHLAKELGYFADQGLEIEIIAMGGGQQIPLLAGGKADASTAYLTPAVLNAIGRGARVRMVAGRENAKPSCATIGTIMGLRKTFPGGLQDASALKGKRVALLRRASFEEFCLDEILKRSGLGLEAVEIVVLEHLAAVGGLLAGRVDAMLTNQLYEQDAARNAAEIVLGPGLADIHPGFQYAQLFFGKTLLDDPGDTGVRFLKAYFRANRDYAAGKTPRFLDEFAQSNKLDPQRLRQMCRGGTVLDGKLDLTGVRRFAEWCVERGYSPASVKNAEFADMRFQAQLGAAARELCSQEHRDA